MFSFTLYRCFSTSIPSTSKYLVRARPSVLKKDPGDQFGLLSYGRAPQTERLKVPTWREEFSKKDKILGWEKTVPERSTMKRIPEITLPATLSTKQRRKMEAKSMGKTVTEAQSQPKSKASKSAKSSTKGATSPTASIAKRPTDVKSRKNPDPSRN